MEPYKTIILRESKITFSCYCVFVIQIAVDGDCWTRTTLK